MHFMEKRKFLLIKIQGKNSNLFSLVKNNKTRLYNLSVFPRQNLEELTRGAQVEYRRPLCCITSHNLVKTGNRTIKISMKG